MVTSIRVEGCSLFVARPTSKNTFRHTKWTWRVRSA